MPTYSFTRTLPEVQKLVLRKLGVLGAGETASSDDAELVNEAIDLRLKEMHALGVLWFNVAGATTNLSLVGGTATVSLSAITDFLFPVSVKLRVGDEDQDVEIISHLEYQNIPNKSETGEPEQVFFSGASAYFWPTPDANYTAKLTYQAIAADTNNPDAPDVPVSMMRSLVTLVAYDCADAFGAPEPRLLRLLSEAKEAEKTIRTLNTQRVDSTTVEADYF
jgi:hypothetical protein